MTRMLGSDAILRSLEAEGVDVMFGIPGGAILPTYDAIARGTTVRHVLARHEQGAGHMAEGYARASGRVGVAMATSGPGATNLVTPIADAWMDSTPLVCITGQVRSNLIGTDAFQETDATGITMPIVKHSWLVLDARDIPQAIKSAFHVARTGRPGPVLVDIAKDAQEGELDFSYPSRARPARLAPADEGARAPGARGGGGDRRGAPADRLRRRRRHQRRRLRRAARARRGGAAPVGRHADGQGLPPRLAPAQLRRSRDARLEVRELGAQQVRPDHRGRRPLRRPRHRQGLGVRARREGDPLRHRRRRGREDPRRRHPGRRAAQARARPADARREGDRGREARRPHRLACPARGVARALPVQVPEGRGRAEAADGDRAAARPLRRARRRLRLDDRRRPAPDVGDAVPAVREAAHVHHLGRARDDGLRPAGRGRRQGRPARRDGRLRRRRRLLPDDLPGARDRGARAAADRRRDHQQRLARDGAPVAGALLRRALRRDPPDQAGARLRAARRGARRRRVHGRQRGRPRRDARLGARLRPHGRRRRPGRSRRELLPDGARRRRERRHHRAPRRERRRAREGHADESSHGLGRAREQARCARARVADVRAARLQHPEPRGRARPSVPTSRA